MHPWHAISVETVGQTFLQMIIINAINPWECDCWQRWLMVSVYPAPFPLEQLYPLTFLLCSDSTSSLFSTPLPQPAGQSPLLRLTSENVWPRPGVQPRAEPIGIQNNISSVGAQHRFQTVSRYPSLQFVKKLSSALPPPCTLELLHSNWC